MLRLGDTLELPVLAVRGASGSGGASWSTQEVIEGKPFLQWMGPAAQPMSISLYFHAAFIQPAATLAALQQLALQQTPFQLSTASGLYLGTFALTDVQYRYQWVLPTGEPLVMTCDITLADASAVGLVEAPKPPGLAAWAEPESVAVPEEDTSGDPDAVSPYTVVRA